MLNVLNQKKKQNMKKENLDQELTTFQHEWLEQLECEALVNLAKQLGKTIKSIGDKVDKHDAN